MEDTIMTNSTENLESLFTQNAEVTEAPKAKKAASQTKAAKVEALRQALAAEADLDPTFISRANLWSNSLEVVNVLGWGNKGNIMVDKTNPRGADGKRNIVPTSKLIGYVVANCGQEPIPYRTEIFTQNADGVWVGEVKDLTLEPGGTCILSRKYMTMLGMQPEVAMALKNGKIVQGPKRDTKSIDATLESMYFNFSNESGHTVNDDDIKLSVGVQDKATGAWHVKPEYLATFGYLENPKPTATRERKTKDSNVGLCMAAMLQQMVRQKGQV